MFGRYNVLAKLGIKVCIFSDERPLLARRQAIFFGAPPPPPLRALGLPPPWGANMVPGYQIRPILEPMGPVLVAQEGWDRAQRLELTSGLLLAGVNPYLMQRCSAQSRDDIATSSCNGTADCCPVSCILVLQEPHRYEPVETNPINFNLLGTREAFADASSSATDAPCLELPQPNLSGVLAAALHGRFFPVKSGSLSRVWEGTRKPFLVPPRL